MKHAVLSVLMLLTSVDVKAQLDPTVLKERYESEVIRTRSFGYDKGGRAYPLRNLKNEFQFSPEGKNLYDLSKSDRRKGWVCFTLWYAALVGGLVADGHNQDYLFYGLSLGSYIPLGLSFHFMIRSESRFSKSIWIRNRDVLIKK